jgi:hypothetical protein
MAASMESNLVVDAEDKTKKFNFARLFSDSFCTKFARGAFPPSQFQ